MQGGSFADQILRQFQGIDSVARVAVGADFSSPLRGDRGAANDRFDPWAQTIPIEGFDHGLLAGHGRRQQSGDADDVGIDFFGLGDELLGGHAGTEIEDLESLAERMVATRFLPMS